MYSFVADCVKIQYLSQSALTFVMVPLWRQRLLSLYIQPLASCKRQEASCTKLATKSVYCNIMFFLFIFYKYCPSGYKCTSNFSASHQFPYLSQDNISPATSCFIPSTPVLLLQSAGNRLSDSVSVAQTVSFRRLSSLVSAAAQDSSLHAQLSIKARTHPRMYSRNS